MSPVCSVNYMPGLDQGKGTTSVVPLCREISSALQRLRFAFWQQQRAAWIVVLRA